MTIRNPSFSGLNVSAEFAGLPESSESASTKFVTSEVISKARKFGTSTENADSLLSFSSDDQTVASLASSANSIYEYDSSFYDSEITGSGITSAYPEIIGTLPFTNFFSKGKETNLGILYDMQNDLRDSTIASANEIVKKYYEIKPSTSASLAAIRDQNLTKYNQVVASVPQIFRSKELIVQATNLGPSELQSLLVGQSIATTSAESQGIPSENSIAPSLDVETIFSTGIGNSVSAGSVLDSIKASITFNSAGSVIDNNQSTGILGNATVEFTDEDIKKYDSNPDIVNSLTKRFLGDGRNQQAKTTSQYQLLKAVLAQLTEGRKFDSIDTEAGYSSPYADLQYQKISPISDFLANSITMNPGMYFAKNTIGTAASIASNGYLSTSGNYADLYTLSEKGILYYAILGFSTEGLAAGQVSATVDGQNPFPLPVGGPTYVYGYDSENVEITPDIPVIAIDNNYLRSDFISQIPLYLASRIVETQVSLPALPASIDPTESQTISVKSTLQDSLRFVSQNQRGEIIYLFDDYLNGSIKNTATAISTAILEDPDNLVTLKSDIDSIVSSLDSFSSNRKFQLSNQCALTIASVMYKHIGSFFSNSVLNASNDSTYSAMRICMFLAASHSTYAAARLLRLITNDGIEILNLVGLGQALSRVIEEDGEISDKIKSILEGPGESTSAGDSKLVNVPLKWTQNSIESSDTVNFEKSGEETVEKFLEYLYDPSGSFAVIQNLINELSDYYPGILSDKKLEYEVRISAFCILLYLFRKLDIKSGYLTLSTSENSDPETGKSLLSYDLRLRWSKKDTAFIADCLSEALNNISVENMSFSQFSTVAGAAPTDDEKEKGQEYFFNSIRSPIKAALQASQDAKSIISYQRTVLSTQSSLISKIKSLYDSLVQIYNGDTQKAKKLIGRYSSLESVTELLYRSNRYQTLIPGTEISSMSTRSSNYRSIVKTVFKSKIPKKDNLSICIVGIPYGLLERMRFTQDEKVYYFGTSAYAGSSRSFDENSPQVDFDFGFIKNSNTIRPNLGGPYCSLVPELYDDFSSTANITSVDDDSISFFQISNTGDSLEIKKRSDSSSNVRSIDIPAILNQAALQSYVEDVYGLYPRYASYKEDISSQIYPESAYADNLLKEMGYKSEGSDDEILLYYRLKSAIMLHKDFMTSMMLKELEASPLFDKIIYLVVDGNNFEDIINDFFVKVEV